MIGSERDGQGETIYADLFANHIINAVNERTGLVDKLEEVWEPEKQKLYLKILRLLR